MTASRVCRHIEGDRGEPGRKGAQERLLGRRLPVTGQDSAAQFVLPNVTDWKGLKLRAEIEVKECATPCGGLSPEAER